MKLFTSIILLSLITNAISGNTKVQEPPLVVKGCGMMIHKEKVEVLTPYKGKNGELLYKYETQVIEKKFYMICGQTK